MARLLRFYAVRRLFALLGCWVLTWITLQLFSGPPAYFDEWPLHGRSMLTSSISGTLKVSFVVWLYLLLKPLLWRSGGLAVASQVLFGFSFVEGLRGGFQLLAAAFHLINIESNGLVPVASHWFRVAGLPLLIGSLPLVALELYERARAEPFLRRLLGRGHVAVWPGPYVIARHAQPLPIRRVKGGFFNKGFIGGKVLASDGDGSPQFILDESPAHWCWIGGPGSGKNICSAPSLAGYLGSFIHVSNKPDACDLYFGGRIDQNRLESIDRGQLDEKPHTDTRGISKTSIWVPGGHGNILDYANQSVYPGSKHTLLSDVDVNDKNARVLALAIADGFFPDKPGSNKDSWFVLAPRNLLAAVILHILSWVLDIRLHNIPYIVERCMGYDSVTGEAGPEVMKSLFNEMLKNNHPHVGAFVRTTAVQIMELGSRSYGTLKSEFHNSCTPAYDSQLREQLIGKSDFSYNDVGLDGKPFTLMHVLPRGDASLRAALPLFRAHVELSMQILQTKLDRPAIPTAFVVDEARQFLQGIQCVTKAPMLLRDARIRMWQMYQSWPGAIETLGERGALEMEACSVMSYFGIDGDLETAKRVSERLGKETFMRRRGHHSKMPHREMVELMTPDRVMKELSVRSPMAYMAGPGMEALRVERLAFKPILTKEGCQFRDLPMPGQFDDGLSRYRYGDGAA